ncbi:uncharacterized protein ACA1_253340 [Acanthamoeba castellanii str. Neff]|uniref:Uncharacterized protein n=1 Tax=Acanthamoeba castellanii (strain ATCC 30010 / Neff) TaxID=1257118 RepID=L8HC66_ACACF|nr:uncharacterized protein ACA1_253340 [Acanthamoeba castellanii str. Neff]ELR22348.1 hypothetical protein ACA1_253340 [Acanthamoeba castellanii str. Neff]
MHLALVVPLFYFLLVVSSVEDSEFYKKPATTTTTAPSPQRTKTLLDAFSDFFVGTKWVSNVQKYYSEYMQTENMEQLELARSELHSIDDDLSRVQTQELILRSRQSELGAWLQENAVKPVEERNPTVEELVSMESDRLALLEHRLNRLKNKLLKQKGDVAAFLKINVKATVRDTLRHTQTGPAGRLVIDPSFEEAEGRNHFISTTDHDDIEG